MTLLPKSIAYFALCSLIMTLGEVVFTVHAQMLLMVNSSGRSSKQYGLSLMIQSLGRMGAGIALFPLVLRSATPWAPFVGGAVAYLVLNAGVPKEFLRRGESP
jgi:hypothetical protein